MNNSGIMRLSGTGSYVKQVASQLITYYDDTHGPAEQVDQMSKQFSSLKPFHETSDCGELSKTLNLRKSQEFENGIRLYQAPKTGEVQGRITGQDDLVQYLRANGQILNMASTNQQRPKTASAQV